MKLVYDKPENFYNIQKLRNRNINSVSEEPILTYMPGMFKELNRGMFDFGDMFSRIRDLSFDTKTEKDGYKESFSNKQSIPEQKSLSKEDIENIRNTFKKLHFNIDVDLLLEKLNLIEKPKVVEKKKEINIAETISDALKIMSIPFAKAFEFIRDIKILPERKSYIASKTKTLSKNIVKFISLPKDIVVGSFEILKESVQELHCDISHTIENKKYQKHLEHNKKLEKTRREFSQKLITYKNMFSNKLAQPDYSEYDNYSNLDLNPLKRLMKLLDSRIKHQNIIQAIEDRYRSGADNYVNNEEKDKLIRLSQIPDLKPKVPYNADSKQFKEELKRLCQLYLQNSKILEGSISTFNDLLKNYFSSAKDKIQEISKMKQNYIFSIGEKIPFLGIVPKSIRVVDQINLTGAVLDDYKEITNKYVEKGIVPIVKKYGKQYSTIELYVSYRNLSSEERIYAKQLLNIVRNAKSKRVGTFAKIFDTYARGGQSIFNICKNIRLKDAIGLGLKFIKLIAAAG